MYVLLTYRIRRQTGLPERLRARLEDAQAAHEVALVDEFEVPGGVRDAAIISDHGFALACRKRGIVISFVNIPHHNTSQFITPHHNKTQHNTAQHNTI
jgi:hypothetical protein